MQPTTDRGFRGLETVFRPGESQIPAAFARHCFLALLALLTPLPCFLALHSDCACHHRHLGEASEPDDKNRGSLRYRRLHLLLGEACQVSSARGPSEFDVSLCALRCDAEPLEPVKGFSRGVVTTLFKVCDD